MRRCFATCSPARRGDERMRLDGEPPSNSGEKWRSSGLGACGLASSGSGLGERVVVFDPSEQEGELDRGRVRLRRLHARAFGRFDRDIRERLESLSPEMRTRSKIALIGRIRSKGRLKTPLTSTATSARPGGRRGRRAGARDAGGKIVHPAAHVDVAMHHPSGADVPSCGLVP